MVQSNALTNAALSRFIVLSMLAGIGVGLAKVTTALYAVSLNPSALELGLIAAAQTAGLLITSLPCGVLVERLGPLRLFVSGSLCAALIYPWVPAIAEPLYLLALTLFASLCMPCRFVSLNTVFMHQLPLMGQTRAGWFRGAQMIGLLLIGPTLAALLIERLGVTGSWHWIALAFALPVLLAPSVLGRYPAQRAVAERLSLRALLQPLALLRTEPALRRNCLLDFSVQAAAMYFAFFIIAITVQDYGWSAGQAAALLSAHGAAFIGALFLLGRVVEGHGNKGLLCSLLLVSAALLTLALARTPALLWLGALLLGISLGLLQIVTLARYAQQGQRLGIGRMAGLAALVGPAGGMSGCLLGGILGTSFSLQQLFLGLAPLFLSFLLAPLGRYCRPFFIARRPS